MMDFNIFGGVRMVEVRPVEIRKDVLRVCKSKVGKRNIRVSYFVEWADTLKDDQVVHNKVTNTMYMNAKTLYQINKATESIKRFGEAVK